MKQISVRRAQSPDDTLHARWPSILIIVLIMVLVHILVLLFRFQVPPAHDYPSPSPSPSPSASSSSSYSYSAPWQLTPRAVLPNTRIGCPHYLNKPQPEPPVATRPSISSEMTFLSKQREKPYSKHHRTPPPAPPAAIPPPPLRSSIMPIHRPCPVCYPVACSEMAVRKTSRARDQERGDRAKAARANTASGSGSLTAMFKQ